MCTAVLSKHMRHVCDICMAMMCVCVWAIMALPHCRSKQFYVPAYGKGHSGQVVRANRFALTSQEREPLRIAITAVHM